MLLLIRLQNKSVSVTNAESSRISQSTQLDVVEAAPKISFQKAVCLLVDAGQGTKKTCEFRLTNTSRGFLKSEKSAAPAAAQSSSSTRNNLPGRNGGSPNAEVCVWGPQTGTIKVIYSAGKAKSKWILDAQKRKLKLITAWYCPSPHLCHYQNP